MMCKNISRLEDKISQTRIELMQIAEETGLNSEDTLLSSQKLDELITRYQKLIKESITSFRNKCRHHPKFGWCLIYYDEMSKCTTLLLCFHVNNMLKVY